LKDHLDGAAKCLDVGAGSGYLTIAMRLLMRKHKNSFVFGVEHIEQLRDLAEENIMNAGFSYYLEEYKVFI
jgi:protein-L-isoaspartate O-methyltransferase